MACYADLGLAIKDYDLKSAGDMCGTPGYVDPEVLFGNLFTTKSDIFSLGCVMYNLLTCRILFGGINVKQILHKNKRSDPAHQVEKYCRNVSPFCVDLIKRMLVQTQKARPSAEECLNHPWFKDSKQIITKMLYAN